MIKFLFFDFRHLERADGFTRTLEPPVVDEEPVLLSEEPWERNYISTYGSVTRRADGLFQMWYTCGQWCKTGLRPAYAESEDGIHWRRPDLGLVKKGGRDTNLLMDAPLIGLSVILDEQNPRDRRYKMLVGAGRHPRISAFRSADGKHWLPLAENPVLGVNPDGPIGLFQSPDGRYVAYHRPCWGDRRIARSESWDFEHWTQPRVVLEPGPVDGTNVQFYGLGATWYGTYEIGTLWVYHTDPDCLGWTKSLGRVNPELVYGRGGYCWHRAMPGDPWVRPAEKPGQPGYGLIQCISQPLMLEDEIRFYFTRSHERHGEDHLARKDRPERQVCVARSKPDRFVAAFCGEKGRILTRPFWHPEPRFFVNARCERDGYIKAEVREVSGAVIPGFEMARSVPFDGNATVAELHWKDDPSWKALRGREIRLNLEVRSASLFSLAAAAKSEVSHYAEFTEPFFLPKELETHEKQRQ